MMIFRKIYHFLVKILVMIFDWFIIVSENEVAFRMFWSFVLWVERL